MADKRINITFDASMDVSKLKSSVAEISKSLQGVTLPTTLGNNFKTTLSNLEREIANFEKRSADGLRSASDFSQLKKSGDSIISLYEKLVKSATELGNLSDKQLTNLMPKPTVDNIKKASAAMETFKATIDKTAKSISSQTQKVEAQKKVIDQLNNDLAVTKGQKTVSTDEYKQMQSDIAAAAQEVKNYEQQQVQLNQSLAQMEQTLKAPSKSSKYRALKKDLDTCSQSLEQAKVKQEQLQEAFNNTTTVTANARDIRKLTQDIADETTKLQGLEAELQTLQSQGNTGAVTQLKTDLQGIQGLDLTQCGDDVQRIETAVNGFQAGQIQQVKDSLVPIINATQSGAGSVKNFAQQFKNLSNDFSTFIDRSREFDMLQSRIQHFFGITNSIMLFRRAINSSIDTIKELDKAMTEVAVVTDLGVGDYWDQLPTYTKRANELGLAIKDVYESMTLFYQQGLNTEQATALSNATLKMARIAGLEAAEATDRMTNALRGFHMELNEESANNVADVYSALAAHTASNVDEISVAMTKVASIADSAGMSFENTAAFLSQIIETTRESAETAGTALKTVIARFSEVKKLQSKGVSTGTDEEGESIDVNKVETALKTVGISMQDFFKGAEGLDSIFIQLTDKWDTLDTYTQRYIATQAAGSRQQSRFIALMSDSARQQELVALANNAAGASAEQYAKTLESLETKLNKLKNAWDQFTMGIANEEVVKFGVDALTELVNIINNCTEAVGDFWGALAKLGLSFGALKAGKVLFSSLFAALKNQAAESGLSSGRVFGQTFSAGMKASFAGIRKLFSKNFWFGLAPDFSGVIPQVERLATSFKGVQSAELSAQAALSVYEKEMATQGTVSEATYQAKIAAEQQLAIARSNHMAILQGLGITEQQYNAVQSLGLTQEEMAIALSDRATMSALAEIATKEGLTEAEKKKQIQDVLSNKTKAQGLIIKAADVLATKFVILAKVKEAIAAKLAAKGLEEETIAMITSLGVIGLFILAVAALVAIFVLLAKAIRNASPEKQFEDAAQASKDAAAAAQEATEAYNDLTESLSALKDEYNGLEELATGTREWKDAVRDVNNEVLDLIEKYPELAGLVENKNGVLTLDVDSDEVQAVVDKYENIMTQADSAANAAEIKKQQKGLTLEYSKMDYGAKAYRVDYEGNVVANRADTEQLAKALVNGDVSKYEGSTIEEQLQNYANANNILINVTDDTIATLQKFGNTIATTDAVIDTYYADMANNAYSAAELVGTEEDRNRAATYATDDLMQSLTEQQQAELGTSKSDKKDLADEYAQQVLGLSATDYKVKDNGNIEYTDASGEEKTVKAEDIRTQMAGVKATEQMTNNIQDFNTTISKASDNFTKHLYDASEGAKLTAKDLEFAGIDFANLDLNTLTAKDQNDNYLLAEARGIKNYYSSLFSDEEIEQLYGGWDKFIQYVAESGQIAANTFDNIKKHLVELGLADNLFDNYDLSAGAVESITSALDAAFDASGTEGVQLMSEYLLNVLKNIDDPKMQEQFNTIIDSIDWADQDSINKNVDLLKELGFVLEDDFANSLIKCTRAVKNLNFDAFREEFLTLQTITDKISKGENISDKDFAELDSEYQQFFTQMADGTYRLTVSAKEFADTVKGILLNDATAKLVSDYNVYSENKSKQAAAGNLSDTELNSLRQYTANENGVMDLALYKKQIELIVSLGIKSREELATLENQIFNSDSQEESKAALAEFNDLVNEAAITYEMLNYEIEANEQQLLEDQALLLSTATTLDDFDYTMQQIVATMGEGSVTEETYSNALIQLASQYENCADKILAYRNAIASGNTEMIVASEELLRASITIGEAAQRYELDVNELQNYADTLYKSMDVSAQAAAQLAIANTRLDAGILNLNQNLEDYNQKLASNNRMSAEWSKTMGSLKKDLANVLNMDISAIGDDFAYDTLKAKDLEKALDGDADAILRLRAAAADQLILDISVNTPDPESITSLWEEIKATIESEEFKAPDFDQTDLINSFNTLIENANMTREQVEAALAGLNVSANLKVDYKEVEHEVPVTSTYTTVAKLDKGDPANGIPPAWKRTQWTVNEKPVKAKEYIPQYTIEGTTDEGGVTTGITKLPAPTVSYSNTTSGIAASSSKSGGSESEPEWENPYDRMYETLQDINAELRERERLEKRYQILCKRGENTQEKTRQYYEDLNKHYEQEYALQQKIANSKAGEINYLMSTYSDVSQYARYDAASGTIDMDWAAVQQLDIANNEEVGKRLEEFVSKLEEAQDAREEAIDAQYDIINEIEDVKQSMRDTYFDLEERVADALKQIDEDLVDEQEKINDALDEAASNLVDAIRDNVNATRQLRDNQNSEEEIAKKERRLAYLRQDTSGANKLEIIQLEQELDDMKLSYQDTIVDQALDKLQTQNDKAAEQRDLQIELARAQIDWNEKNAVYVDQFKGLLETALAPDGTLDMESKLVKTLEQGENWNGLSREQQTETLKNLTNDVITAISALENNLLDNDVTNDDIGGNLNKIDTGDIGKVTPTTPSSPSSPSTPAPSSPSATAEQIKGVAAAIWCVGSSTSGWGTGSTRKTRLTEKMGSSAASQVQSLLNKADTGDTTLYNYWANTLGKNASQFYYGAFKTGGLADFTGPAWLDGTKAKPEMVLNATDTQNLIQLKDILGDILRTGINNNGNSGDYSFDIDINVDEIGNDYDVNRLAAQVKQELVDAMTYRNNNSVSYLR